MREARTLVAWRHVMPWLRACLLLLVGFVSGATVVGLRVPPYERLRRSAVAQALARRLRERDWTIRFNAASPRDRPGPSREQTEKIAALRSLGYLRGVTPGGTRSGVTVLKRALVHPGLNLCIDGMRPEAVLMTPEGHPVHRWSIEFEKAFPGASPDQRGDENRRYWRHVRLLPNGEILAIFEGNGLVKLDRDSRVVWTYPGSAHHDLDVADDGTIYVLTRTAEMLDRIDKHEPVLHDFVTMLTPDGKVLRSVSLLAAIERSDYSALLGLSPRSGDLFHTNSLRILDGSLSREIPSFGRGSVLVGMRTNSAIAVIDLATERVVWAAAGGWLHQHDATVLANGHLMLFDNLGDHGSSRVIEFDPRTLSHVWSYRGSEHSMFTRYCGMSRRLPNGNTLIVESERGRAFEVTCSQETVWEYITPNRAGKDGELIASLFEVHRIEPGFVTPWLGSAAGP